MQEIFVLEYILELKDKTLSEKLLLFKQIMSQLMLDFITIDFKYSRTVKITKKLDAKRPTKEKQSNGGYIIANFWRRRSGHDF